MNYLHTYTAALYALLFSFGASIGSYLNVVAYRLPLGMSTVAPSSHCPCCQSKISPLALIPIFGYFLVKGRCSKCFASISAIYPIVEFLSGLGTCLIVYLLQGGPIRFFSQIFHFRHYIENGNSLGNMRIVIAGLWLFYSAIPLSIIDLKYRILPDRITLPGICVGLGLGSLIPSLGFSGSAVGIATGGGFLFGIAKLYEFIRKREGMGLGDVKYLAMIGALVGWEGVLYVIILSSFLGAFIGIVYSFVKKSSLLTEEIPFGPFLALGGILVFIYQHIYIQ